MASIFSPGGWISQFTPAVRAAFPFAQAAVASGMKKTPFYDMMLAKGIGGRKQAMLNMYQGLIDAWKDPSLYMPDDMSKLPIIDLIPPALTRSFNRYTYLITYNYQDLDIDEELTRTEAVSSSVLISEEDAIAMLMDVEPSIRYEGIGEVKGIISVSMLRSSAPLNR